MLVLENIRKSYKIGPVDVEVLKGVNLRVEKGEITAILGSSGCGKSTLMNILGLLDTPSKGRYYLNGKDTADLSEDNQADIRNHTIGFVFQQFNLLPRLTSLENVALPLTYRGTPSSQREQIAREMLEQVGMGDRVKHKPGELSGGQQQRVAIARALSGSPALILADEPTGALDSQTGSDVMQLFMRLNRENGITTVLITHDPGIAKQCGRSVRMRDGIIVQD